MGINWCWTNTVEQHWLCREQISAPGRFGWTGTLRDGLERMPRRPVIRPRSSSGKPDPEAFARGHAQRTTRRRTTIFSTEFALRLMGDVQLYFIDKKVRNFYSVSISGYHIAEAGANPISQLAFTLANGFTYVEYYLSRGMDINAFAPNLSFFFSNGMDPEYAVMGRVARRRGASEFAGQMP